MDKYILNEKNGLWYELVGDYYFPCLTVPAEEEQLIGIWGQRHLRYVKQHRKALYTALWIGGKLNAYLAGIDRQAQEMFFQLVNEYAHRQGITERLKAENQIEWVGLMNNCKAQAEEIIMVELIYC